MENRELHDYFQKIRNLREGPQTVLTVLVFVLGTISSLLILRTVHLNLAMVQPPSVVLKNVFAKLKGTFPSSKCINEMAQKVLWSPTEVQMWFQHLQVIADNRKQGAAKAAETRWKRKEEKLQVKKSQAQVDYYCSVCQEPYIEFTDEIENWICCENCEVWYHFVCAGIVNEPQNCCHLFVCCHLYFTVCVCCHSYFTVTTHCGMGKAIVNSPERI